ncbi:hypothetical protein ANN_03841 [Periplaneta americana]|uniref:Uncharacterized protein n=1 Tax=Periplaneta americana TaxID=6978 RepID=A0ABQ8TZY8_PERAM|nr:hypothetical protein ANN_03841 [Periplaneta americana]
MCSWAFSWRKMLSTSTPSGSWSKSSSITCNTDIVAHIVGGSQSADSGVSQSADSENSWSADSEGSQSTDSENSRSADSEGSQSADSENSRSADSEGSQSADSGVLSQLIQGVLSQLILRIPGQLIQGVLSQLIQGVPSQLIQGVLNEFDALKNGAPAMSVTDVIGRTATATGVSRASVYRMLDEKINADSTGTEIRTPGRTFLMEKPDIVAKRFHYLRKMQELRASGRPTVYLDETWLNVNHITGKVTFRPDDVTLLFQSKVTPENWRKACESVEKEEKFYWEKDGLIGEVIDRFVINIGEIDSEDEGCEHSRGEQASTDMMEGIAPMPTTPQYSLGQEFKLPPCNKFHVEHVAGCSKLYSHPDRQRKLFSESSRKTKRRKTEHLREAVDPAALALATQISLKSSVSGVAMAALDINTNSYLEKDNSIVTVTSWVQCEKSVLGKSSTLFNQILQARYINRVAIKKKKIEDVGKILQYIPQEYLSFYEERQTWPTYDAEEGADDDDDDDV